MKVLVVGGGGREHAIVRALSRSPSTSEVLCAPGNAGIAEDARLVDAGAEDVQAIVEAAKAEAVDLVVVGPEAPLVSGLVDALESDGNPRLRPNRGGGDARGLEGLREGDDGRGWSSDCRVRGGRQRDARR